MLWKATRASAIDSFTPIKQLLDKKALRNKQQRTKCSPEYKLRWC